jgi:F-type H+-transporting ATPase subunit b
MNIIPDPFLALLQVVPFLVLMAGLHAILFKPMLAYLHDRTHATVGARKDAQALSEKADARLAELEAALARARSEVADLRAARRADAQRAYQAVITEARQAADLQIGDAVDVIHGEATQAREQLDAHARTLARDIASQVLGRPLVTQLEA